MRRKEKTEQDAGTDLLTAPETEDVNKEEPNKEHDKPVSKKKPSLFQKGLCKCQSPFRICLICCL